MKVFQGRLNRSSWFAGIVLGCIVAFVLIFLLSQISRSEGSPSLAMITVVEFLMVLFIASLHIRRFHDLGKSGWFLLFLLIPGVNFAALAALAFMKGDDAANKYGAPAKKPTIQTILGVA